MFCKCAWAWKRRSLPVVKIMVLWLLLSQCFLGYIRVTGRNKWRKTLTKNPDKQHTKRMVKLASAAGKAVKGERREAFCGEGMLPFLLWLPVLQTVGQHKNSLRKFSKAEIHPCLSLQGALLSILLKSACIQGAWKLVQSGEVYGSKDSGKVYGGKEHGGWGVGVCWYSWE